MGCVILGNDLIFLHKQKRKKNLRAILFYTKKVIANFVLGVSTPKGRRGHTALVHRGSMLVYGGYQDLKGSCSELWAYHFGMT